MTGRPGPPARADETKWSFFVYQNIMIPLDGSPLAEQALPIAMDLAWRCGAPLLLFQVRTTSTHLHLPRSIEATEKQSADYLRTQAQRFSTPAVEIRCEHVRGYPANAI